MKNVHESHAMMVRGLFKDGQEIADAMTGDEAYILHAAVGVSGESGELMLATRGGDGMKKCRVCEELKDLEEFYRDEHKSDSLRSICKGCDKKDKREPKALRH